MKQIPLPFLSFFICFLFSGLIYPQGQNTSLAEELFDEASNLTLAGKFDLSNNRLIEAATEFQKNSNWEKWIYCQLKIGQNYRFLGKVDSSMIFTDKGFVEGKKLLGENHPHIARFHNEYGIYSFYSGNYNQCLDHFKLSLKILIDNYGEAHSDVGAGYNNIGQVYKRVLSDYDSAEIYLVKSLEINRGLMGEKHKSLLDAYGNLANLYSERGYFELAYKYVDKTIEVVEYNNMENQPDVAMVYRVIGGIYAMSGNEQKAFMYWERGLDLLEKNIGPYHPIAAQIYEVMGEAYLLQSELDMALYCFEKEKEIIIKANIQDEFRLGELYSKLGEVKSEMGDKEQALVFFEKSDIAYSKFEAPENLVLQNKAYNLGNIGAMYISMGNYENAMKFTDDAISLKNKADFSSYISGQLYTQKSLVYFNIGEVDSALQWGQKALIEFSNGFDSEDLNLNPSINEYVWKDRAVLNAVFQKINNVNKSIQNGDASFIDGGIGAVQLADNMMRENIHRLGVYEKSKEQMSQFYSKIYGSGVNFYVNYYNKTGQYKYFQEAYKMAEKGKSTLLSQAVFNTEAVNFAGVHDSFLLAEKKILTDVNYYEKKIKEAEEVSDFAKMKMYKNGKLFELKKRQEELVEFLENNYPEYHKLKYESPIVSLDEVALVMKENELVIEIVFDEFGEQVFFLCINKNQLLKIYSEKLEKGYVANVQSLQNLVKSSSLPRADKRKKFIQLSHELYQQFIKPIEKEIAGKEKLIIIGEGITNYIPFEVLLKNGEDKPFEKLDFMVNDFEISYHYSATLFHRSRMEKINKTENNLLAFAPIFGEEGSNHLIAERNRSIIDTTLSAFRGDDFSPLFYSEKEVNEINKLFTGKNKSTNIYTYQEANEKILKEQLEKGYQYVHIASHSFSNIKQPKFSGIACSQPDEKETITERQEDGILHVGEIYNLDVPADLVVLSSCESGIGKLVAGEGMLGLNRSFVYAGVPNVVFSLWKVNDKTTSEMMVDFYGSILEGKSYASALREAKLNMLKNKATASPNLWAAFLLMGR